MTKHRRTRRRRINQKGGLFGFFESNPNVPTQSWGDYFNSFGTKAKEAGNMINTSIGNAASATLETANKYNPLASNEINSDQVPSQFPAQVPSQVPSQFPVQVPAQPNSTGSFGGTHRTRARMRARSMKGGKGGLGLTYYAAPVSDLKVAEPTTWQYYANGTNQYSVKGGSRKRRGRKSRRSRRRKPY